MNRAQAIRTRALGRVGADSTATNIDAEASGLMTFLGSSVGIMVIGSVLGLWLLTR